MRELEDIHISASGQWLGENFDHQSELENVLESCLNPENPQYTRQWLSFVAISQLFPMEQFAWNWFLKITNYGC